MNYIYDLIARAIPTKSVDTIVSLLTKVTARLAAAEAAQTARAEALQKQANDLLSQAAAASAEADRASRVRENLATLTA